MREFKGRAWDTEEKTMIENFTNVLTTEDVFIMADIFDDDERYKKMQYIGLKDKNLKEIYEGDLLFAFGAIIGAIWHNGSFGYIASRHTGFIAFSANQHLVINGGVCEKLEVVGNIFENPELIK